MFNVTAFMVCVCATTSNYGVLVFTLKTKNIICSYKTSEWLVYNLVPYQNVWKIKLLNEFLKLCGYIWIYILSQIHIHDIKNIVMILKNKI